MRGVMNDAEGVNQVVGFDGHKGGQLLGAAGVETHLILETVNLHALARQFQRLRRQIHRRDRRSVPREVDGVGADAAADFEDFLAAPALEVGEARNVRLDKILAGFDFVEVFARAHRLGRVADVAGTLVPVAAHLLDRDLRKISHRLLCGQQLSQGCSPTGVSHSKCTEAYSR